MITCSKILISKDKDYDKNELQNIIQTALNAASEYENLSKLYSNGSIDHRSELQKQCICFLNGLMAFQKYLTQFKIQTAQRSSNLKLKNRLVATNNQKENIDIYRTYKDIYILGWKLCLQLRQFFTGEKMMFEIGVEDFDHHMHVQTYSIAEVEKGINIAINDNNLAILQLSSSLETWNKNIKYQELSENKLNATLDQVMDWGTYTKGSKAYDKKSAIDIGVKQNEIRYRYRKTAPDKNVWLSFSGGKKPYVDAYWYQKGGDSKNVYGYNRGWLFEWYMNAYYNSTDQDLFNPDSDYPLQKFFSQNSAGNMKFLKGGDYTVAMENYQIEARQAKFGNQQILTLTELSATSQRLILSLEKFISILNQSDSIIKTSAVKQLIAPVVSSNKEVASKYAKDIWEIINNNLTN